MALQADWTLAAAKEITEVDSRCHCSTMSEDLAQSIVERHCPFKKDVAYMPVPRCDGCRHWRRFELEDKGICERANEAILFAVEPDGLETREEFGCVAWEAKT